MHNAYYCAERGSRFAVKCCLLRPAPEGFAFGARVYVDSGSTAVTYARAGAEPGDHGDVDAAEFDHYFWFGPGETTYVVHGFYRDAATSFPFEFGSTAANTTGATSGGYEAARDIGVIRIQFAKVERWLPKRRVVQKTRLRQSAGALLADAKGQRLAAKAAAEAAADGLDDVDVDAVLSPGVLYESRLFYNDFDGYRRQASAGSAMLDPYAFRGLPLRAFEEPDVRRRCVDTFLRALQRGQLIIETQVHLASLSEPDRGCDDTSLNIGTNDPVDIGHVVDALSRTLSPAASYLTCLGERKPGNYGEGNVQRFGKDIADQDREPKLRALEAYFADRPDLYHLHPLTKKQRRSSATLTDQFEVNQVLSGYWFPSLGRQNRKAKSKALSPKKKKTKMTRAYAVSFAAIVISDEDDGGS